jgi:hypothetical protein
MNHYATNGSIYYNYNKITSTRGYVRVVHAPVWLVVRRLSYIYTRHILLLLLLLQYLSIVMRTGIGAGGRNNTAFPHDLTSRTGLATNCTIKQTN